MSILKRVILLILICASSLVIVYASGVVPAFPQCFSSGGTPTPGPVAVQLYYLGSFAQTAGFNLTTTSHGPLNVACRTGWRIIQPTSGTPVWTSVDACQSAAHGAGTKWSLSIKIGADVPLWLFNSSCTATPQPGESGPGAGGTLNAETFTWNQNFEYTNGSTQCLPVPWESNFLTTLNTFINLVAAHVGPFGAIGTDPSLDHVVVTGLNSITQENLQPYQASDLTQWEQYLSQDGMTCANPPSSCPQYNAAITTAYNTIIADWGTAFPNNVGLASMYVDQPSFPFNNTNTFARSLMTQLSTYNQVRSLPMNNAAAVSNGQAFFPAPILTLNSTNQRVAFQELGPQGCPANPLTLVNAATADQIYLLEIYPADFSCL